MTDLEHLEKDVDLLKEHVLSQDKASPGLLLRMDRMERMLELMTKLIAWGGGLAVVWRVIDLIAEKAVGS